MLYFLASSPSSSTLLSLFCTSCPHPFSMHQSLIASFYALTNTILLKCYARSWEVNVVRCWSSCNISLLVFPLDKQAMQFLLSKFGRSLKLTQRRVCQSVPVGWWAISPWQGDWHFKILNWQQCHKSNSLTDDWWHMLSIVSSWYKRVTN